MLATLAQDGKYSLSSMSPFCLPSKRETVEGESKAAYQGTTLSWAPKPFMTAEQSGFATEVTAHTYQADNLIF